MIAAQRIALSRAGGSGFLGNRESRHGSRSGYR